MTGDSSGVMHTASCQVPRSAGTIAGMIDLILLVAAGFTIGAALLGLAALYTQFGLAALWLAVGAIYLVYLALQRSGAGYFDPGGAFGGGPALPPPAAPQIGRSQRPALPGPKK
jgi:hypothetical protein